MAAKVSCAEGQENPLTACGVASAGVIPLLVTSCAACSGSRGGIRHRGGRVGTDSVNVLRGHPWLSHLRRSLTQRRPAASLARRTSHGHHHLACAHRDRVLDIQPDIGLPRSRSAGPTPKRTRQRGHLAARSNQPLEPRIDSESTISTIGLASSRSTPHLCRVRRITDTGWMLLCPGPGPQRKRTR